MFLKQTSGFSIEGLALRSQRFASGAGRAHALTFSDAARYPQWAAAVRPTKGAPHLADGAPQCLQKAIEALQAGKGAAQPPFFLLTQGAANAGLGELSSMSEAGLLKGLGALLGRASAALHFASGPAMTMLPAGECLSAVSALIDADSAVAADIEPKRTRVLPFLFDGLAASAGAWLLDAQESASHWGARTLVCATDMAVSQSVLAELLEDLWLGGLERSASRAMMGDALLLCATGARAAEQQAPVLSLKDPRAGTLRAVWMAAVEDLWRAAERSRTLPEVFEPFSLAVRPLALEVAGAASRGEALRTGGAISARLRVWAENDVRCAQSAEGVIDLLQCLWSALLLDAGIESLERRPIEVRIGEEVLMAEGLPAGAWLQPSRPGSAALERWQSASQKWRTGALPLTLRLGRGPVAARFWA